MTKTATGAQRYNNRMDKIFDNAKKAKQQAKKKYQEIYNHLIKTGQGFCFSEWYGGAVSREDCLKYIND